MPYDDPALSWSAVHRCASEAKKIAAEAEELSRAVCLALIRKIFKTAG